MAPERGYRSRLGGAVVERSVVDISDVYVRGKKEDEREDDP